MNNRSSKPAIWTGAAVLLLLLLGYMSFWWNRGIQLNSNGLPTLAAHAILEGKFPYLDFHYWCPPGHLFVYTALAAMFGDGLIYVRAFAVAERMAIFLIVYFWLARIFSARSAFFGTFAAGVGFSSDICDVLAHYDYDALLASVAAGYALSIGLSSKSGAARWMFFVGGLCAGAGMVAKQTQGVGMFLVLLVIAAVGSRQAGFLAAVRNVFGYLAGWAVPTGLTALWLIRGGAWREFLLQAFLQGTSSKGSLREVLLRPLLTLAYQRRLALAFAIAMALMGANVWISRKDRAIPRNAAAETLAPWLMWAACAFALAAGFAGAWWLPAPAETGAVRDALVGFSAICIFISFYGSAALGLRYSFEALLGRLDETDLQKWTIASVSAVTAYMFSLSWAAYEKMLLPGFAFVAAMILDRQMEKAGHRFWSARGLAVAALGLALVSTASFRKLTWPYAWENWADGPIKEDTVASDFPEMRGVLLDRQSADFLARVTGIIRDNTSPEDTILCYPNYTLFYVLSHRKPGVFAYMHWFDIASDQLVREEAARIKARPPKLILFVDLPEWLVRLKEISFRGGARSGQRDLADAIQSLPGYRVIESVPIPRRDFDLKIYAPR